jgi:hypothetical protein
LIRNLPRLPVCFHIVVARVQHANAVDLNGKHGGSKHMSRGRRGEANTLNKTGIDESVPFLKLRVTSHVMSGDGRFLSMILQILLHCTK